MDVVVTLKKDGLAVVPPIIDVITTPLLKSNLSTWHNYQRDEMSLSPIVPKICLRGGKKTPGVFRNTGCLLPSFKVLILGRGLVRFRYEP